MNNPEEYDQQPQPDPMPSGQPAAASSGGSRNKLVIGGIALGAAVVAAGGFAAMNMLGNNDTNDDVALPKPNKTATSPTATPTGAPTGAPNGQSNAAPDPDATPLPTLTALSGRNPFLAPIVAAKPGTGGGSNAGSGSGSGNQGSNSPSTGGGETKSGRGTTTNTGTGSSGSGTNSGGTSGSGSSGTSGGTGTSNSTVPKSQLDQANAVANKAIADLATAKQQLEASKATQAQLEQSVTDLTKSNMDQIQANTDLQNQLNSHKDPAGVKVAIPDKSEVAFLGMVTKENPQGCTFNAESPTYVMKVTNTTNGQAVDPAPTYCVGEGMTFVNPEHYKHLPAHVLMLKKVEGTGPDATATIGFFDKTYTIKKDASQVLFDTTPAVAPAKKAQVQKKP